MDIEKVILVEIACAKKEPQLYKSVKEHMIHKPCEIAKIPSPCMKNRSCTQFYPKKF